MRGTIITTSLLTFLLFSNVFGQSLIRESVRNGDFNQGYIPGDFYSDLIYFDDQNLLQSTSPGTNCHWATLNKYYISDNNQVFKCGGYVNQGSSFCMDWHTAGMKGSSDKIMFVDPPSDTILAPVIWQQSVDVFKNETYTLSFWVNIINSPQAFIGATINGSEVMLTKTDTIPFNIEITRARIEDYQIVKDQNGENIRDTTQGTVKWIQYTGEWTSNDTAMAEIKLKAFGDENLSEPTGKIGYDFALDNISLINSCQNIHGANAYVIDFNLMDTVNLCETGGEIELNPHVPSGERSNAFVEWFKGQGNEATLIDSGSFSKTITSPGYYTVNVDDPDNACVQGKSIVVVENIEIDINDVELCIPSVVEVDAGIHPNSAFSINWTGPSGWYSYGGRTYDVTDEGTHTLTINPLNGHDGCSAVETFDVISYLPRIDTIGYCIGDDRVEVKMYDGREYKWSNSWDMYNIIGIGNSIFYDIPDGSNSDIHVWVQNAETTPVGTFGPNFDSIQGHGYSTHYSDLTTNFTAHKRIVIKTAKMGVYWNCVQPNDPNNVTIDLIDVLDNNSVITSKSVKVPCFSPELISLDIEVPPGKYKLRAKIREGLNSEFLSITNWANNPDLFSIDEVIEITGYSMHYGAFGNMEIEESNACDPVPIILIPDSCGGITNIEGENIDDAQEINIYPNPVMDYIQIQTEEESKIKSLQLVNILGETLYQGEFQSRISVSQLETGIYFLKIKSENSEIEKTVKIIKR